MIPTSWKDITIAQFYAANEVLNTKYDDAVDQHIALLSAVSGIPDEEILKMERLKFLNAVKSLSFMNDLDSISTNFPKVFTLNGVIYKPCQGVSMFTTGQDVDFRHSIKGTESDRLNNMHKILATLILPCDSLGNVERYNGAKVKELSEIFLNHLTMDITYPVGVFFCNLIVTLFPYILPFIQSELRETMTIPLTHSLTPTAS